MELYQHQKSFLEKNPNKSALIWSCGTGKTRTAVMWSKQWTGTTIIICPKALKANWEREIVELCNGEIEVFTKEEFRRDYKLFGKATQIIVDEVHIGFLTPNWKSQMSKALKNYIKHHQVKRVLLLTATPFTSSPWNIYNLAWLTGHEWNWREFKYRFFNEIRMGPRVVPVPKKGCEKELAKLTKEIADVVDMLECIDIPEQIFEMEYFELNSKQKSAIEDAYDPLPIVRFTKIHEIENGVISTHDKKETIPIAKFERIQSLCEENKKIIIVCRYNAQIDALKAVLSSYKLFVIRGDVKDQDNVVRAAEASTEAVVLIQAACSVGYELPSFRIMVFASMDYSFVNFKQICGRILRITNPQKNLYLRLIGGEMDQAVSDAIDKKEDFHIEVYAKRK